MKKETIKALDVFLKNIDEENNIREEVFIELIRKTVLEKNCIELSSYINFLNRSLGNIYHVLEKDFALEDIQKKLVNELDLMMLCSILEQYMNNQKRELTGSYYTPRFIVEFIVSNSIILSLYENTEINRISLEKLVNDEIVSNINNPQMLELLTILKKLKIIDISCGSGLFLHYTLEKIFAIKTLLYKELNLEIDEYYEKKWILENNIFGIDIQHIPLEMVALKYIDMLGAYNEFNLDFLNLNFYQKNSILGDEIFSIPKIYEVIKQGGFDIVIGNPPYIGEKGNKNIFEDIRSYEFGKRCYEAKMDYFYYFVYRGIDILKDNGVLSYITTNYFITADGAKKLRKFLKNNVSFRDIINFNEYEIFKAAKGQHNIIFTLTKDNYEDNDINIKYLKSNNLDTNEISELIKNKKVNTGNMINYILEKQSSLYGMNGNIMLFPDSKYSKIVKKIKSYCNFTLGDLCNINQGIVSGADKVTNRMIEGKFKKENIDKYKIDIDEGIFVLNQEDILNNNAGVCRLLKPFYKNSDIKKYFTNRSTDKYILYITDKNISNSDYCFIIQEHLKKYQDVLDLRRETKKGTRNWFALQWSREQSIFEGPKIVVPHRAVYNNFGYNEDMWYASADVYFITIKNSDVDLKLLLGILNSKITYFWLYNMGKRKGDYLELYSSPLSEIPINLSFDCRTRQRILDIINEILYCCKDDYNHKLIEMHQEKIDKILYGAFGFTQEEIDIIEDLYR